MILLVVIGVIAGVAMRQSVTTQKIGTSLRLDALAQQSAENALRTCEEELGKLPDKRQAEFVGANTLTAVPADQLRWNDPASWETGSTLAGQAVHYILPAGTTPDASPPQCLVERMSTSGGQVAFVVTARGFSPGYGFDAAQSRIVSGSTVWLQSFLYFE